MVVEDSEECAIYPEADAGHPIVSTNTTIAIDQLIERWWQDYFPGSAIARDTQAWNAAFAAKEALRRLLKKEYLTCN